MEDIYGNLQKAGKNGVDDIIKWMQDAKLIEKAKESEDKVRKLFEDANDTKNIELAKFKEVVGKLAAEQKKTIEEFTKKMTEVGPKFLEAAMAGVSAFKEALNK